MRPVVLVTAIGSAASSTIISQLRNSGNYYIIGGDIYPSNQVVTSKDVDEFYVFPPAIHDFDGFINFIVAFCKEHKVNYYFATIDEEIVNLSMHRERVEETGVKLCIPNHNFIMVSHYKDIFSDWIDENIPEIGTKRYKHFLNVEKYPVFIKPKEGRGSIGCRKIESEQEVQELLNHGFQEDDYLIQEYQDSEIIAVDLVRNAKTGQTASIQRVEHLRNSSGCGISVEIIDNESLNGICDTIMEKLQLNGVVNAEFFHKVNKGVDEFKIIEINPRYGAGTSFTCLAGCDIVTAAIDIVEGRACKLDSPAIGAHLAKRYETYRLD